MSAATDWMARLLRIPPRPEPPASHGEDVLIFRASPRYFYYKLLVWASAQTAALFGILGSTMFIALARGGGQLPGFDQLGVLETIALLGFLIQLPFSLLLVRLDFSLRWYILAGRSLRIREGAWTVREKTLTYANIQNISIRQNPFQRMFGLTTVAVRAAGGGAASSTQAGGASHTHEARFDGVDNGEEIRRVLRERVRRMTDSGLGDPEERAVVHDGSSATGTVMAREGVARGALPAAVEAARLEAAKRLLAEVRLWRGAA